MLKTQTKTCSCRNCNREYDPIKSRAELKGYCSAKCQHEKSRTLGWRKRNKETESRFLRRHNAVGDKVVIKPEDTKYSLNSLTGKTEHKANDPIQLDIAAPALVEVSVSNEGKVLHVNVNGQCVLRCCRIGLIEVDVEGRTMATGDDEGIDIRGRDFPGHGW